MAGKAAYLCVGYRKNVCDWNGRFGKGIRTRHITAVDGILGVDRGVPVLAIGNLNAGHHRMIEQIRQFGHPIHYIESDQRFDEPKADFRSYRTATWVAIEKTIFDDGPHVAGILADAMDDAENQHLWNFHDKLRYDLIRHQTRVISDINAEHDLLLRHAQDFAGFNLLLNSQQKAAVLYTSNENFKGAVVNSYGQSVGIEWQYENGYITLVKLPSDMINRLGKIFDHEPIEQVEMKDRGLWIKLEHLRRDDGTIERYRAHFIADLPETDTSDLGRVPHRRYDQMIDEPTREDLITEIPGHFDLFLQEVSRAVSYPEWMARFYPD